MQSVCRKRVLAAKGLDEWAVAKLETGIVRINPTQYYRGAAFFVVSTCVAELHELEPAVRANHLMEMAEVAEAVLRSSGGRQMNYEALGNSVPHLHWWLTPPHVDDPRPRGPIWEDLDFLRHQWTGGCRPDPARLAELRSSLFEELRRRDLRTIHPLFEIGE